MLIFPSNLLRSPRLHLYSTHRNPIFPEECISWSRFLSEKEQSNMWQNHLSTPLHPCFLALGFWCTGGGRGTWTKLAFRPQLHSFAATPMGLPVCVRPAHKSTGMRTYNCYCCVTSVVSNSVRPHRRQPTRLPRPWDSPGKNTGVGCHFLLQCMKGKSESKVAQSCLTLSDPMDCSLPGSSIHGIFQARVLEWGGPINHLCTFYLPLTFPLSYELLSEWVKSFSRVQLFVTPWTAAYQAPPSMGFPRQEYWSGVPSPSPNVQLLNSEWAKEC